MKIKEKAKAYWEENQDSIIAKAAGVGATLIMITCAVCAYKMGRNDVINSKQYIGNEHIADFLLDAKKVYPNTFTSARTIDTRGFKLDQLGEFGKCIINTGASEDKILTHILAIGPDKK